MKDDLGDRADALRVEVVNLRKEVQALRARQVVGERRLWLVVGAALAALALLAAIGVTAYRGLQTDERLDSLCPVLALVVGGYEPTSRPEGPARDRYIQSFDVMRKSYVELGCARTSPLVPPRTPE